MKKYLIVFVAFFGIMSVTQAQKIKVESGDMSFMEDLAEISVEFEYPDDMKYGKETQQAYIERNVKDKEADVEGSGDAWEANFIGDRARYNERFVFGLEKYSKMFVAESDPDFKYTMIVTTTFTEPGFQFMVKSRNSAIDLKIDFVETDAPDKVIATIIVSKAPGASHPDKGERVADAYFTAAQTLGKYLKKKYL